jgi:hypothetical protein
MFAATAIGYKRTKAPLRATPHDAVLALLDCLPSAVEIDAELLADLLCIPDTGAATLLDKLEAAGAWRAPWGASTRCEGPRWGPRMRRRLSIPFRFDCPQSVPVSGRTPPSLFPGIGIRGG